MARAGERLRKPLPPGRSPGRSEHERHRRVRRSLGAARPGQLGPSPAPAAAGTSTRPVQPRRQDRPQKRLPRRGRPRDRQCPSSVETWLARALPSEAPGALPGAIMNPGTARIKGAVLRWAFTSASPSAPDCGATVWARLRRVEARQSGALRRVAVCVRHGRLTEDQFRRERSCPGVTVDRRPTRANMDAVEANLPPSAIGCSRQHAVIGISGRLRPLMLAVADYRTPPPSATGADSRTSVLVDPRRG